jgi:hypothetical protein
MSSKDSLESFNIDSFISIKEGYFEYLSNTVIDRVEVTVEIIEVSSILLMI